MAQPPAPRPRRRLFDLLPVAVVFAGLFGLSFLPPDNSRHDIDVAGRLSVCMPSSYPPLVTGNTTAPGFEVELVRLIAERNGWRLNIVSSAAMGRDFNPRSWRITRAQCQMLAGGIALNRTTSSFLDTGPPHLVTGWALVAPTATTLAEVQGQVGFLAALTGLDRLALAQHLRQQNITARVVNNAAALATGIRNGDYAAAITESLLAGQLFGDSGEAITLLGPPIESFGLGLAFWKGDLTLRQAVESTMAQLWADGSIATLAARYDVEDAFLCPPSAGCPGS